jgi:hypothetical protein
MSMYERCESSELRRRTDVMALLRVVCVDTNRSAASTSVVVFGGSYVLCSSLIRHVYEARHQLWGAVHSTRANRAPKGKHEVVSTLTQSSFCPPRPRPNPPSTSLLSLATLAHT